MADNRDATGMGGTGGSGHTGADWSTEDSYWRGNFSSRPYAKSDRSYDFYEPAYKYGYESKQQHRGKKWNDVESDLERGWDKSKGKSNSAWQDIKAAARDAWDRVERAMPGDAARDGK
ncbi:MAG: hypothetical protein ACR2G6_15915 [Gemmatimonadaceae bacterium]